MKNSVWYFPHVANILHAIMFHINVLLLMMKFEIVTKRDLDSSGERKAILIVQTTSKTITKLRIIEM